LYLITLGNPTHSLELPWRRDQSAAKSRNSTTHNIHNRQTSMPRAGFEPANPAIEGAADLRLIAASFWNVERNNCLRSATCSVLSAFSDEDFCLVRLEAMQIVT